MLYQRILYVLLMGLGLVRGAPFQEDSVKRYDNYSVFEIRVNTAEQLEQLEAVSNQYELSYWREIRQWGEKCDIMVPPQMRQKFNEFLTNAQVEFAVKIENVQKLIDAQKPQSLLRFNAMDWTQYHTLDEINAWLDDIATRFTGIVTPFSIGKSFEGREIKGVRISYKPGNKAVFIESMIHAREWITAASITYIIDELLVSRNPLVRDIAENVDWYIIPVLNVDGFVYSHEKDRLWRKSRLPSDPSGKCIGTDLNRNFDFLWRLVGASSDPCSQTYAGPSAESDPEIKQMLRYINESIPEDTIRIYISLHSYGQYVLSPWGHTDQELPAHFPQMMAVAKGYADALNRRYGTVFTYGSSATTLYKVSGSGKEWAYGVKAIPLPYTIELRDKGSYGFVLPPEQIIPVSKEVLDGFVGMIQAARNEGLL